jgi:hypothetical protein
MKDEQTKIAEFWSWFHSVAGALAANVESPALVKEIDNRVRDLDPKLSWEIGPGLSKPWQLVISPNLNRDLREKARAIVSRAPALFAWEFHAARPPKEWDYTLELENTEGDLVRLNASRWTFVLLRYPDGAHEVLLKGNDLSHLRDDERWQAAAITLESILGEDVVLDRISEFELVDDFEPRFAERQRPIQDLREAVVGR